MTSGQTLNDWTCLVRSNCDIDTSNNKYIHLSLQPLNVFIFVHLHIVQHVIQLKTTAVVTHGCLADLRLIGGFEGIFVGM